MKKILLTIPLVLATSAGASELTFGFNSPAFSGNGYSTHVLTIEQLEQQRKDKILADEQALIDKAKRDARNPTSLTSVRKSIKCALTLCCIVFIKKLQ